jgi:hypothetical protein
MKYGYTDALAALRPGTSWILRDISDYSTLEWHETNLLNAPSSEEVNTKIVELDAAEPMRLLRAERDRLLQECDWWALVDQTLTTERAAYRQALRDITIDAAPLLNEQYDLDLNSVTWPTKPS